MSDTEKKKYLTKAYRQDMNAFCECITHEKLNKLFKDIVFELIEFNNLRKDRKLKQIDIPNVVAPLCDIFCGSMYRIERFLRDLDNCDRCFPIFRDDMESNEKNIYLYLSMANLCGEFGEVYSAYEYNYILHFYMIKKSLGQGNEKVFYNFALNKVSHVLCGNLVNNQERYGDLEYSLRFLNDYEV